MHERNTLASWIGDECWRDLLSVVGRETDVAVTESILFKNSQRPRLVLPRNGDGADTPQSEQLELASLLKRWAACISQLQRHLTRHSACRLSLERLAHDEPEVARLSDAVVEQGMNVAGFRRRLEEYVGDLERSIEQLHAEVLGLRPTMPTTGPVGLSSSNSADEQVGDMDLAERDSMLDFLLSSSGSPSWTGAAKALLAQATGETDASHEAAFSAPSTGHTPDPGRVAQYMQDVERAARRRMGLGKDGGGADDPPAWTGAGGSARAASDAVGSSFPC